MVHCKNCLNNYYYSNELLSDVHAVLDGDAALGVGEWVEGDEVD